MASPGLPTPGPLCPAKAPRLLPKCSQDSFSCVLCFRLETGCHLQTPVALVACERAQARVKPEGTRHWGLCPWDLGSVALRLRRAQSWLHETVNLDKRRLQHSRNRGDFQTQAEGRLGQRQFNSQDPLGAAGGQVGAVLSSSVIGTPSRAEHCCSPLTSECASSELRGRGGGGEALMLPEAQALSTVLLGGQTGRNMSSLQIISFWRLRVLAEFLQKLNFCRRTTIRFYFYSFVLLFTFDFK